MVLETERLRLRHFAPDDAPFVVRLFNDPTFLRFIGDKGVRTEADAHVYIDQEFVLSYARNGFGPYCVVEKESGRSIGLCGLLRRDWLDDVDIGFALLPEFWYRGYAVEAARGVLQHATTALGLRRVVAITDMENADSIKLLDKIGFALEGTVRKSAAEPPLNLFAIEHS